MLFVYFLVAVGYGNRNAVFLGGQQRRKENEVRLNHRSRFAMNELFTVGSERIVSIQGLP
jgi:hypothetical protein